MENVKKVMGDKVLIKVGDATTKTASGIEVVENKDTSATLIGTVVGVGPGRRYDDGVVYPVGLAVGDKVLFMQSNQITYKGSTYYLASEVEILLVVE